MGSEAQMDLAADFVRTFRRDRSTIFICDPVMGDHGKIYKTYTPAMCAGMTRLAELADVIVTPGTEFGPQYVHQFRINFSQDKEKAAAAMKRLFAVMERYRKQ